MKFEPVNTTHLLLAAGAVVVAAAVVYQVRQGAADAVTKIGQSVDPTSRDNIFYRGVNKVGESISGRQGWTLGGWIYDVTHPGEFGP